jgi:hypothetical protein
LFFNWLSTETGVPSDLGPLFIVFLFDKPKIIKHSSYHIYADDMELYIPFTLNDIVDKCDLISADIVSVIDYCTKHNLILNVSKAILIVTQRYLTKLAASPVPQFIIEDFVIPFSDKVNNLGVIVDCTLILTTSRLF